MLSWPPILEPKKISFSYFWLRIFLKNISFIENFLSGMLWLHKKFVLNFFYLSFWPMYNLVKGDFLDRLLNCKRSTYTWVNAVCFHAWLNFYTASQIKIHKQQSSHLPDIGVFHIMSQLPRWCSKTRQQTNNYYWYNKLIIWELNSNVFSLLRLCKIFAVLPSLLASYRKRFNYFL